MIGALALLLVSLGILLIAAIVLGGLRRLVLRHLPQFTVDALEAHEVALYRAARLRP